MLLKGLPRVRLVAGAYEAEVSPHGGGRLCRLAWYGPDGVRELVVPVDGAEAFDPDRWPKAGAFPMLPYTNRLAHGRFHWEGVDHQIRMTPGQAHGVHGMGHRQAWQVAESGPRHVSLQWSHHADEREWPWSFTAALSYVLSEQGLEVALAIRNDASCSMPAILGWHPYVPETWLTLDRAGGRGSRLHDLGAEGLHFPQLATEQTGVRAIAVDLRVPHTLVVENWSSLWELQAANGECWRISSDAAHLVHHVPLERRYACVEPVTALPGSLNGPDPRVGIALAPGAWRRLRCVVQAGASMVT